MKSYRCVFYHTKGRTTLEISADDGKSAAIAAVSTLAALHYERVEVWDETGLVITRDTPIVRATVDILAAPTVAAANGHAQAGGSEIKALHHHARAKELRVIAQSVNDEYARKLLLDIASEYDDMAKTFETLAASQHKLQQAPDAASR